MLKACGADAPYCMHLAGHSNFYGLIINMDYNVHTCRSGRSDGMETIHVCIMHVGGDETPPTFGIDSTPRSRVTKKNERGETPLHIACIKGDVKTATSLINQGAGVNEVDNAGKSVCVTCTCNLEKSVKLFINRTSTDFPMHVYVHTW